MCNHYCTTRSKVAKVRAELKTFGTEDLERIVFSLSH